MASLRKINNRYFLYFYDKNRSPKRKSYATGETRKRLAKKVKTRLEEEYAEGTFDPWNPDNKPAQQHRTFSKARSQFLEHKKGTIRPKSYESYREVLENLKLDVMLPDVSADHLRKYVCSRKNTVPKSRKRGKGRRKETVTVATLRKRYRHLRTFFNWAVDQGLIDTSPLEEITPPKKEKKVPEFLTREQVERILRGIDAYREIQQNEPGITADVQFLKDLIHLAVCTGMRRGELCSLKWSAVDLDSGHITVRNTGDFRTKSGDERRIPIVGKAREVLERRNAQRTDEQHVLTNANSGKPIRPNYATRRFKKFVCEAKLKNRDDISLHSLRHTAASWLVQSGVPLGVVQNVLGHSTQRVTERYAHMAPDVIRKGMEKAFG